jgi:nascent polypeptide-associated complex subunit alpha
MMPNIDPRQMKAMMAKMGIKSTEIPASRVIIESDGKSIIISSPEVTKIEAQGSVSFQISGEVSEQEAKVEVEITADDIDMVSQSTGITDKEKIEQALKEEDGDIARTIVRLKKEATPA